MQKKQPFYGDGVAVRPFFAGAGEPPWRHDPGTSSESDAVDAMSSSSELKM